MSIEVRYIAWAVVVGIGATVFMDLWNLLLKRAFGIRSLDFCLVGRWFGHMLEGTFRHANIQAATQTRFECPMGLISHYAIGIVFAVAFVIGASGEWLLHPRLLPALLYGIGTVVFPFFLLQPALGFGMAASRTPHPTQARLKSLMTHTVFGIGLYGSALAVSRLL